LDPVEVADARMEYDLECSGYNVRQFLGTISSQGTLGELGHTVLADLLAVVEDIEQETGATLDGGNEEGWEMFQTRVGVGHQTKIVVCARLSYLFLWLCVQYLICPASIAISMCCIQTCHCTALTNLASAGHWQEAWSG